MVSNNRNVGKESQKTGDSIPQFESKVAAVLGSKMQNKYKSVLKNKPGKSSCSTNCKCSEPHPTILKYKKLTSACSDLEDEEREKAVFYGQFLKQWT